MRHFLKNINKEADRIDFLEHYLFGENNNVSGMHQYSSGLSWVSKLMYEAGSAKNSEELLKIALKDFSVLLGRKNFIPVI